MKFANALLLGGLVFLAVPLLIHLINQRRAKPITFPAIHFLVFSERRISRWTRLRERIVLLIRTILVAAIVFAVAQPYQETLRSISSNVFDGAPLAIVIDDTLSMERLIDGKSAFVRAQAQLGDLIALIPSGTSVTLVRVARQTGVDQVVIGPTQDLGAVRRAMFELKALPATGTLNDAINLARNVAKSNENRASHTVVVSDFARHGIVAKFNNIYPIDVTSNDNSAKTDDIHGNYAITDVYLNDHQRVTAELCNFSAAKKNLLVAAYADDQRVNEVTTELAAYNCSTKILHYNQATPQKVAVQIEQKDPLPFDNKRQLVVAKENTIRVAIVNGSPSLANYLDEVFYLRSALTTPNQRGEKIFSVQVFSDLRSSDFEDGIKRQLYDLVILSNVSQISNDSVNLLKQFVQAGHGLMLTAGSQIDQDAYNQHLAELLPKPLRGVYAGNLRLASFNNATTLPGLKHVKVEKVLRLDPTTDDATHTVITLTDGTPLAVERPYGKGNILFWATTIDRDWTDFPIHPGYLPLIRSLVQGLSGKSSASGLDATIAKNNLNSIIKTEADWRAINPSTLKEESSTGQRIPLVNRLSPTFAWLALAFLAIEGFLLRKS